MTGCDITSYQDSFLGYGAAKLFAASLEGLDLVVKGAWSDAFSLFNKN